MCSLDLKGGEFNAEKKGFFPDPVSKFDSYGIDVVITTSASAVPQVGLHLAKASDATASPIPKTEIQMAANALRPRSLQSLLRDALYNLSDYLQFGIDEMFKPSR